MGQDTARRRQALERIFRMADPIAGSAPGEYWLVAAWFAAQISQSRVTGIW